MDARILSIFTSRGEQILNLSFVLSGYFVFVKFPSGRVIIEVLLNLLLRVYHILNFSMDVVGVFWMVELELQVPKLCLNLVGLFLVHKSEDLLSGC